MTSSFPTQFRHLAAECPFDVDPTLAGSLGAYRDLLVEWNSRINLIRFTDDTHLIARHLLDSLAGVGVIDEELARMGVAAADVRLLDIGSGAGLPGLVLAIARPAWRVTLVESVGKKTSFLHSARRALSLEKLEVVNGRVETLPPASFDVVTGRAVAKPPAFLELARPMARPEGRVIAWLSAEDAAALPPHAIERTLDYTLPGDDVRRCVAVIRP
ncbi:16S rRNA (guanine(527)-N(7))-methyltransferase RsmG [bacterium]|nr:16S rRNA (guanine(527)-N(7))-methyltransferase RsmG [bacterium]